MSTFQDQFVLLHNIQFGTQLYNTKVMINGRAKRTDDNDIELKTTLQELMLYLLGNRVKTNVRRRTNLFDCCGHDGSKDKGYGRRTLWK